MYSSVPLALLFTAFISSVRCTSTFSVPGGPGPAGDYSDNPVYKVGDQKVFQWDSDLENMDLLIWQEYPTATETESYYVRIVQNKRYTSQPWTVSLDGFSTLTRNGEDPVFYLALYQSGSNNWDATSHYFNISLPVTSTSSASAEATTTSSVTLQASPGPTNTVTSSDTSSSATATSDPEDDNTDPGLSTGAVAGIAVGSTLGGVFALAGVGFLLWRHFRKGGPRGQYTQGQQVPPPTEEYKPPELAGGEWNHVPQQPVYGQPGYAQGPGGLHEVP
ncbi:Fc.00g033110.m01.CDS01 [Cosmosporella sp. VM-42]